MTESFSLFLFVFLKIKKIKEWLKCFIQKIDQIGLKKLKISTQFSQKIIHKKHIVL